MKILIVSNLYPPYHIGGYELACRDTVRALEATGHECLVLTSDFGMKEEVSIEVAVPVVREMLLHHNWGYDYRVSEFNIVQQHNLQCLSHQIEMFRPDVVYAWNLYGLGWKLLDAFKASGGPACTFHFMDWSIMAYQRTLRKTVASLLGRVQNQWTNVAARVRRAIFISDFTREQLLLRPEFSSVIYPFLDAGPIPEKKEYRLTKQVRAVFIGQIETHKGIYFLCETLERFRRSHGYDIRLDIYGLSKNGKGLELTSRYGKFISVVTNTDRNTLLGRLSGYDLGFFPSLWEEPFGIAQIEMMAAGLPVISSGRGGSGEVSNGHNVILYSHDQEDELIQALAGLLSDYDKLAPALGSAAREYVLQNHSVSSYLTQLEQHLNQVSSSTEIVR